MTTIKEMVQGAEIDIVVTTTTAFGIPTIAEFVISKGIVPKVEHDLVDAGLVLDSTTQFTVTLVEADTLTLDPGDYTMQALITTSSKKKSITFTDTVLRIIKRADFSL